MLTGLLLQVTLQEIVDQLQLFQRYLLQAVEVVELIRILELMEDLVEVVEIVRLDLEVVIHLPLLLLRVILVVQQVMLHLTMEWVAEVELVEQEIFLLVQLQPKVGQVEQEFQQKLQDQL